MRLTTKYLLPIAIICFLPLSVEASTFGETSQDSLVTIHKSYLDSLEASLKSLENNKKVSYSRELEDSIKTLNKKLDTNEKQLEEQGRMMASLKLELDNLKEFREYWLKQMVDEAEKKWGEVALSSVNLKELDSDIEEISRFAIPENSGVKDTHSWMLELRDWTQLYQNGYVCISEKYDNNQVQQVSDNLSSMISSGSPRGARSDELSALEKQVNSYGSAVLYTKYLINRIEKKFKGYNASVISQNMNSFLDGQESVFGSISAMNPYPWLKSAFEEYKHDLCKFGVVEDSPSRKEIMDIVVPE